MSNEDDRKKHSERVGQKQTKLANKIKTAKAFGMDHVVKNPHKYHKSGLFNCGNPKCVMCMNPRKAFGEKTMQERKFEQTEKIKDE